MNWEQLLSLKRFGDTNKRLRKEQDETRLGFEVDYDRIIFSSEFKTEMEANAKNSAEMQNRMSEFNELMSTYNGNLRQINDKYNNILGGK